MVYAFLSYKDQFVTRMVSLIDNFVKFKMINLHLERISDIALTDIEKEKKYMTERDSLQIVLV